jgi:hypothetical protein
LSFIMVFSMSLENPYTSDQNQISDNLREIKLFESSVWEPNGTAICTEIMSLSQSLQICSDGVGGVIITWADQRDGLSNIYAQRVNSSGGFMWSMNGVAICTDPYAQGEPKICSDGMGGAIIAWEDSRSLSKDIYAQRVNASGNVQWTPNGIKICTNVNDQKNLEIISDDAHGAIIVWEDYRGVNVRSDIYVQRINATGIVKWTSNGTVVCNAAGYQVNPKICRDGSGGAVITWEDQRVQDAIGDIYAQRILASGGYYWVPNGTAICTANWAQSSPQICLAGNLAIITWQDYRGASLDIYAQRIDYLGAVQWTGNGTAICTMSGPQSNPQICSAGTNNAIITWQDSRGTTSDIYAQRVNATGVNQWLGNGTAICTLNLTTDCNPQICSVGLGTAIIVWESSGDIYAQRITFTGDAQWTANGTPICTANSTQSHPAICSLGAGNAIIAWYDLRPGTYWNLYAQRTDSVPPSNFAIYAPTTWVNDGTPSVICQFYESMSGINISTVQYAYSKSGSSTPENWAAVNGVYNDAACTDLAVDGDIGWLYAKVDAVPFNQDSGTQNRIRFRAMDMTDNLGTQTTATIIQIDRQIEAPSGLAVSPSGWSNINSFNLTWTNPSDLSGIIGAYYKLDAPPSSNFDGIYTAGTDLNTITGISLSGDGVHTLYLWLVDAAGNINFNQHNTTSLQLDSTIEAPSGLAVSPSGWSNINSFNLTWTNPPDLSGIIGAYYKLDTPPNSDLDGTYTAGADLNTTTGISLSGDGVHTLYLWLVDAAGNINFSLYDIVTLKLDNTIEVPAGLTASPSDWTDVNNFTLIWTNPSDYSGIIGAYYKLDSPPTSNTDGTYCGDINITTITGISVSVEGIHPVYLWLVDVIGNVNFTKYNSTTFYFGTNPEHPQIPFPSPLIPVIIGALMVIIYVHRNKKPRAIPKK